MVDNMLIAVIKLYTVDTGVDGASLITSTLLFRFLVTETFPFGDNQVLVSFGTPGVEAFVRIVPETSLLDDDIFRLDPAEGSVSFLRCRSLIDLARE